jgi:hypothetical protein
MLPSLLGPPGLILIGSIFAAIGALWASHQQATFERQLREKSDEIAALNRRLLAEVTGGDSFPSLSLLLENDKNTGLLVVQHHGDHPLFDVSARLVDLEKFDAIAKQQKLTFEYFTSADTYLQLGTLVPGFVNVRGNVEIGSYNRRGFNIFFVARNGGFTESYRLAKVHGSWTSAKRVTCDRDGKVLLEEIRDDFPRSSDGHVEW